MNLNDLMFFNFLFNGYGISDQTVDSSDGDINYYGYINPKGEWYIMKEDTSYGDSNTKKWLYKKDSSGYSTNWAARESLEYGTFQEAFK